MNMHFIKICRSPNVISWYSQVYKNLIFFFKKDNQVSVVLYNKKRDFNNCRAECKGLFSINRRTFPWHVCVLSVHPHNSLMEIDGHFESKRFFTGVHPGRCNSPNLRAPDTQFTCTDGKALCQTSVSRWVCRVWVGIKCFSNIHVRLTKTTSYIKSKQYVFEKNIVMFRPHLDQFRGTWGLPSQNKS